MTDILVDNWIHVCASEDLPAGEGRRVDSCPPIAVFNVRGEFFATDDTCTHSDYSLADGYLDGDVIECELHFATFSVRTGAALSAPAVKPLGIYPVRVVDGELYVAAARRCLISRSGT